MEIESNEDARKGGQSADRADEPSLWRCALGIVLAVAKKPRLACVTKMQCWGTGIISSLAICFRRALAHAGRVGFCLAIPLLSAQIERGVKVASSPDSGRRLALVIGNDNYADAPLRNAINDARAMAAALQDVGFEPVRIRFDVGQEQLAAAVDEFVKDIRPGDTALLYYAGHAMQIEGLNYYI